MMMIIITIVEEKKYSSKILIKVLPCVNMEYIEHMVIQNLSSSTQIWLVCSVEFENEKINFVSPSIHVEQALCTCDEGYLSCNGS